MNNLVAREIFIEKLKDMEKITMDEWNKPLYRCPRCDGEVKRDYSEMYMSNPPKYRYYCKNCSYEEVL